jgi:DNA-binding transcriptional LysR family regulator
METLANLESFVRSAETGGFSAAARRLALTPAAVSRNVAKLTLTEAGERFLASVQGHLQGVQDAIAGMAQAQGEPAGVLKVSVALGFGLDHVLPLLPAFLERYPGIRPDWQFDNRQVDLVAEGFDAAIGGGIELAPGMVSRPLAPAHIIAVASPDYMSTRTKPRDPTGLARLEGIVMRSARTGRVRHWMMRNAKGVEMAASVPESIVVSDPAAMCRAAQLGLGVALIAVPDALPHLDNGSLVRLLPQWHADAGSISLYYAHRSLLAPKTRAFVDFVVEAFARERLSQRFAG